LNLARLMALLLVDVFSGGKALLGFGWLPG